VKINENSRIAVSWPISPKSAPVSQAPKGQDGISLRGKAEAEELLRRLPDSDGPDLERVAAAAAQMKDGVYPVSAEDLADAILDDLSTVMAWLSDTTASKA